MCRSYAKGQRERRCCLWWVTLKMIDGRDSLGRKGIEEEKYLEGEREGSKEKASLCITMRLREADREKSKSTERR